MTWRTFAGGDGDVYAALVRQRCEEDGGGPADPAALAAALHRHLHRGVGYLAGDRGITGVEDLIVKAAATRTEPR